MKVTDFIDALGGTTATARLAQVRPPSVHEWRERDHIPAGRLVLLACEAERRGIAPRWALMPDTWHLIWPELVGRPGVPAPRCDEQMRDAA